jgi:tRNA-dihydrouridine synthase
MTTPDLPWGSILHPLLLAPMQGLTNRGMRQVFGETVRPDVLFTEFVRVRPGAEQSVTDADFLEATTTTSGLPLVVQVIGSADEGVVQATRDLVDRGVRHVNVNMGCPWGRMTSVLAGGGMFRAPETVEPMLRELRSIVPGSLSVKTRTGIDDEREFFDVLPAFEASGVDFVVVHARTVKQKYRGAANHELTREIVEQCSLPVIANGDVATEADARRVLECTGAAGLMLGRGAISDPLLFERIRGNAASCPTGHGRKGEVAAFLLRVLDAYKPLFQGDTQVLAKFGSVLTHITDDGLRRWVKSLKKLKQVDRMRAALLDAGPA